jgi:hypothetical protein
MRRQNAARVETRAWEDCGQPGAFRRDDGTPEETPVEQAERWLREDGVQLDKTLPYAAWAVLIAEAVNWAAKVIDGEYYDLKPRVVDYVSQCVGVRGGWYGGAYYMYHYAVGVVSFHDPHGEITASGCWPFPWSGVSRQEHVFECLAGDVGLIGVLAELTTPLELAGSLPIV